MGLAARFHCRADPPTPRLRHHVERSKLFVLDRVASIEELDGARIARAIEFTRFPYSPLIDEREIDEEGSLLRAADLIGQLGDPHYLRKAHALYYEFEEIGMNKQLGYESPADVVDKYPQFYWSSISPHIQAAIDYLNVTSSGRRWISGLYSNVFRAEREFDFRGHSRSKVYCAGHRGTAHVFTTGRGTPYGLAAVPVIKVATRSELARCWHDLMDRRRQRIATGSATRRYVGWSPRGFAVSARCNPDRSFHGMD